MIGNLQNLISKVFYAPSTTAATPVTSSSDNPFGNPFVTNSTKNYYGKNNPVKGGYFVGYYNGKPNIVGKRLFLEV